MTLRSGFVTILGRPNVGKSTLLNALVGSKIAIVAAKPQTTRAALSGVVTVDHRYPFAGHLIPQSRDKQENSDTEPVAQIIFVDTPGIHQPESRLDEQMMEEVRSSLAERDLLLFLADASQPFHRRDESALDWIKRAGAASFLVLNKIDRIKKAAMLDRKSVV